MPIFSCENTKILACIPFHFRPDRIRMLADVARTLMSFPVEKTVLYIHTNTDNPGAVNILQKLVDQLDQTGSSRVVSCTSLRTPFELTWAHKSLVRELFLAPLGDFSHFIYIEDDIRFDFANFAFFVELRSKLRPHGLLPGFLRLEFSEQKKHFVHVDNFVSSNGIPKVAFDDAVGFTDLPNPFHAAYVLDRDLANEYIESKSFSLDASAEVSIMGIPERSAMGLCFENVPTGFYSRYVLPFDKRTGRTPAASWITHLSNNYSDREDSPFAKLPIQDVFTI